ncbi:MAG: flagellar biosynthesis protein FlhF [Treponema sp.]|jgi:flagellar biosynthesis protein FlhF|nr:flagellar biosynthesis protein FlhF [Treponema sp.]
MQVYVERGVSKGDCLQKIVNKYGAYFTVLREKTYRPTGFMGLFSREGVELEFCLSPLRGLGSTSPLQDAPLQGAPLQGASSQGTETYTQLPGGQAPSRHSVRRDDTTLDFVEAKKRVLAAAGKDPDQIFQEIQEQDETEAETQSRNQQLILDKLEKIQKKIETGTEKAEHPNLVRISQMLKTNDFSDRYTAGILEKARKELPLDTLENFNAVQDRVVGWIGESIQIYDVPDRPAKRRIMALVGPTGVGKTTTIAKLAAIYGIENSGRRPLSVRMITIDAFRIGAGKQIEAYGDIMEIPVSYIDNHRDLRREIDLYHEETDLILVDTIGRSPRDSVKLGEMKELLNACGSKAEIHLALAASTKTSDIEHILQQFEPFDYQAVMLTKLDETRHIGNVISALAERGKPVSYIADGQIVPKDIRKASVVRLLINLDEFRVDREEIEKQFPAAGADQFQWS